MKMVPPLYRFFRRVLNPRAALSKFAIAGLFTALLLVWPAHQAVAQSTYTWTGNGTDNNWSTAGNWGGAAPSSPQAILNFAGSTRTTSSNNLGDWSGGFQIYFNSGAGAFTLTGNAVKFWDWGGTQARIENDSSNLQTVSFMIGVGNSFGLTLNANTGDLLFNGSAIYLDNSSTLTTNANSGRTITISNVIQNAGGNLYVTGLGSTILTGANTYTGTTTINSGTLQLGDGTTGHDGSIAGASIVDNANLTYNLYASGNYSGVISGTGNVTKTGNATLTLSGTSANTYTGTTTVSGGSTSYLNLSKTDGVNAIAGNMTIGVGSSAGFVQLMASNQIADTSIVSLDGNATNARGVLRLNGFSETIGGLNSVITGGGVVDNNGTSNSTLTLNVASGSQNFSGQIRNQGTGTLALVKTGAGTQIISSLSPVGNNSYTGGTQINDGILQVGSANALSTGNITFGGGALQYSTNGTGTDYSAQFKNSASAITLDTNGQNVTLANATDSTNTGGLIKTGSGTLILQNTGNSYTGPNSGSLSANGTQINAGMLGIYGDGSLGLAPASPYANIQFTGSATLQDTANNITLNATRNISVATGATATFDTNGHALTINGIVGSTGAANVVKVGSGTLTVSSSAGGLANNSTWTVQGGSYNSTTGLYDSTLALAAGNVLGNATGSVLNLNGGTLQFTANGGSGYLSTRTINVMASGGAISDGGFAPGDATAGGSQIAPAITIASGSGLDLVSTNAIKLYSAISGNGTLTKFGNGTATLLGSNTYTGVTTLKAGTLNVGSANALGGGGNVTFSGGALQYSSSNQADYGSRIVNSASAIIIDTNSQTVTLSSLGSSNTGGLVKDGAGTLKLSANMTFTGGVTLNSGTLGIYEGTSLGPIPGSPATQLTFGGNSTLQFQQTPTALPLNANRLIAINPGVTATIDTQAYTPSIAGVISGATGALAKVGSGNLTLYGNNTYGGGTTVTAGTLTLGSAAALGSSTGALSVSGATLNMGNYSATVGALTSSNGTFTGFNLGLSSNTLAASSATLSGTTYIGINPTSISGTGTSNLITSSGGGLTGTFQFAGAQTLSVPVASLIVKTGNGTFYQASLNSTGTAEQIIVLSAPGKVLSIMPLGASIMAGSSAQSPYNGGGFHTEMYQNLVNDGRFTPNFVGSSTSLQANNPTGTNVLTTAGQTNNEGHPGYTTNQILNNLNANDSSAGNNGGYWLAPANGVNPNYIPLNVGGNDLVANHTDTQAINRYDAIISQLNTLRAGVDTLATNLMYRTDVGTYSNTYFNPYVQGVVYNHVLAGQNVQFVDLYGLITPNNSTTYISSDGIHPTQVGYNLMGDIMYSSTVYGAAYWTGNQGGNWSTLNGTSTNWAMDSALTTDRQALLTNATANTYSYADVFFNGNASPLATTLGGNTTVRSLNFAAGASGAVTVGGNSTLTIGSGGITVQQGTGAHTVSSNIALASDQIWGNVSSNNLTVSGVVGGSGNLTIVGSYTVYTGNSSTSITPTTVTGTGAIVLSGANTYTGTTTISSGTLQIGNGGSTGSLNTASAITNNGTLAFNRNNTITQGTDFAGTLSGSGNVVQMGTGTLVLAGTNTYTGTTTIKNGTLQFEGSGNANSSAIYLGDTSGSNSATLNLNGVNQTYSSAVTVQAGSSGTTMINSLNASGTNVLSSTITLNRATTLSAAGGGTLQVNTITGVSSANTLTIGGLGTVILSGSADNTNLTINATSGTLVLAKTNSGPGGFGAGVRSLGGTLTVAGGLVQLGGTGQGGSTTSVDQIYDGASVVVNSGTFDLNARSETISGFSGSGGNVTNTAASSTATLTVGYNGAGGTYSGTLQDGGSGKVLALTKEGAGTLTLSGANTYSGDTRILAGNLTVAAGGTLGSGSNVFVSLNAALNVNTNTTVSSVREAGTGDGGFIALGSGATLTINGADKGTLYQNSIAGAGGLTMAGSGTTSLSLYNPQTYTGTTTVSGAKISTGVAMSSLAYVISGGTFEATADNILSDTATMTVNSGTFSAGGTDTIGALSGTGGTVSIASGKTLTTSFNSASDSFAGTIAGAGAFTKAGNGTLTLSGNNTYTGSTSATGGKLVVNGILASSSLTVGPNATLGGTGTIAGDTTIQGTHSPGNSPGIQNFGGNLTYSGGSSAVNWELSANTNINAANPNAFFDTVVVARNLNFGGVTDLNLSFKPVGGNVIWSDSFWQTSRTGTNGWLIYDVAGGISNFSNLNLIAANWLDSAGNSFDAVLVSSSFSLYQNGHSIYLDYTASTVTTPEPSSGVAMAVVAVLGGTAFLSRRRRVQP